MNFSTDTKLEVIVNDRDIHGETLDEFVDDVPTVTREAAITALASDLNAPP